MCASGGSKRNPLCQPRTATQRPPCFPPDPRRLAGEPVCLEQISPVLKVCVKLNHSFQNLSPPRLSPVVPRWQCPSALDPHVHGSPANTTRSETLLHPQLKVSSSVPTQAAYPLSSWELSGREIFILLHLSMAPESTDHALFEARSSSAF